MTYEKEMSLQELYEEHKMLQNELVIKLHETNDLIIKRLSEFLSPNESHENELNEIRDKIATLQTRIKQIRSDMQRYYQY
jgi:uncharacterized protein (DUF342 family)